MNWRPHPRPSIGRWALIYGAIALGAFSTDIAVTEAIDGAATQSQENLLWGSAAVAVAALAAGVAGYVASSSDARRPLALATAYLAGVIGLIRVSFLGARLVGHVRLDRDEPLTTMSLTLQIAVALVSAGALLTFARRESRAVGRFIVAGDIVRRRNPTPTDVGPNGRCPTN